ncbi:uncharacterized protein LOC121800511 isoform X2 [Salvia splendens]|uniref:uncharacterized protein LOC121800511 isoform X2 n=1 Tax=Salvia splendens TaxID=180675 RepID=UPI001C278303|nr:uncharacterized protein LOC121800511 isoform X2 [Salvia splendens]
MSWKQVSRVAPDKVDVRYSRDKVKASHVEITTFTVGNWKREAIYRGTLTAKFYYAHKKLVWEFLYGLRKSKIEVSWSDIIAIEAVTNPDQPGFLRIQLAKPPLFFREITPQPRKPTKWKPADDFTGGQSLLCSTHEATFPPGELYKHYEMLLIKDEHLAELSRRRFPTNDHLAELSRWPFPTNDNNDKPKASNVTITSFLVGNWKRVSNYQGDLTAKFHYAKKKLVWNFFDGPRKIKMEVSWSDITAIEAVMNPNQLGCLRIDLASTPLFFREISPQPGKHSTWEPTDDFTNGQAHLYMYVYTYFLLVFHSANILRLNVFSNRTHEAMFLPGVLDKYYEELLIYDKYLAELSRRPFPNQDKHMNELRLLSGSADFSSQKALVAHHDQRVDDPIVVSASTYVDSSSSQNSSVVPDQHLYERNDMIGGGNEASSISPAPPARPWREGDE